MLVRNDDISGSKRISCFQALKFPYWGRPTLCRDTRNLCNRDWNVPQFLLGEIKFRDDNKFPITGTEFRETRDCAGYQKCDPCAGTDGTRACQEHHNCLCNEFCDNGCCQLSSYCQENPNDWDCDPDTDSSYCWRRRQLAANATRQFEPPPVATPPHRRELGVTQCKANYAGGGSSQTCCEQDSNAMVHDQSVICKADKPTCINYVSGQQYGTCVEAPLCPYEEEEVCEGAGCVPWSEVIVRFDRAKALHPIPGTTTNEIGTTVEDCKDLCDKTAKCNHILYVSGCFDSQDYTANHHHCYLFSAMGAPKKLSETYGCTYATTQPVPEVRHFKRQCSVRAGGGSSGR